MCNTARGLTPRSVSPPDQRVLTAWGKASVALERPPQGRHVAPRQRACGKPGQRGCGGLVPDTGPREASDAGGFSHLGESLGFLGGDVGNLVDLVGGEAGHLAELAGQFDC